MGTTTEPVYLRVLEDLRGRIHSGALGPGARIPSRNAIIANYGVGETAAKHALAVLAAEGLIEARPGSGSYVRKVPAARILEHDRPGFPGSPFGVQETAPVGGNGDGTATVTRRLAWEHQTEQGPAPAQVAARLASGRRCGPRRPRWRFRRARSRWSSAGYSTRPAAASRPARWWCRPSGSGSGTGSPPPGHHADQAGLALLAELAQTCVRRGYGRLEWWVLDWPGPGRPRRRP